MDLQKMIIDELNKKAENGEIQKKVEEYTNKMIESTLKNVLTDYDGVGRNIQKKLKEQMCQSIEKYNFNEYLPKLEVVLNEIIKSTTLQGKKMIQNFQQFMSIERFQNIKISEILNSYGDFVAENVDTTDLEIDYDDEPRYYDVLVNLECKRSYFGSSFEFQLSCEKDERLTKIFDIRENYDKDGYYLSNTRNNSNRMLSLDNLDSFDIFLIQLDNQYAKVEKDIEEDDLEVEVKAEPEATFE